MKKIIIFIISCNFLYGFDLIEDTVEFLFEDVAQVLGIIAMILVAMYFIKRFLREDSNSSKRFSYHREEEDNNRTDIVKRDSSRVYDIKSNKDN
ncbi:hypothetical protein [Brachyspira pilosicoli]|uniref:hypothetical protein n=1 Tax=Brachyspira pilosicoli TaxID=52584 RepID=UPI001CA5026C|nr:hypothetical protein [Brachyspira pilosicoli]MBW5398362.1 hypothetical protein [Brachyspira pilosicoli]